MSRIRSRYTGLDLKMKSILDEARVEYVMYHGLFGHPDFLVRGKVALFCDSSFWHGRNWTRLEGQLSRGSNSAYWLDRISKNRRRDKLVSRHLRTEGYVVVRLWDEDIFKRPEKCIAKLREAVNSVTRHRATLPRL
jgi:DNA mismatch endonuclease, patch repair protein